MKQTLFNKASAWLLPRGRHFFWSPEFKRHGHTGESPVKGIEDVKGTGVSLLWGEVERAGRELPGEELTRTVVFFQLVTRQS